MLGCFQGKDDAKPKSLDVYHACVFNVGLYCFLRTSCSGFSGFGCCLAFFVNYGFFYFVSFVSRGFCDD